MAIRGIHHVAIATRDIDRLVAFYRDVVGFTVVAEGGWPRGSTLIDEIVGLENSSSRTAMLRAANTHIEIFEYSAPEPGPGDPHRLVHEPGYTHFCLDVTDIDAEYERLLAGGMTFHRPPPAPGELGPGHRATYGRDPDGNVIELQETLDHSSPTYLDLD
ncbi:MAG: VOC family protein [Acidimicrobiales bacterium]